MTAQANGTRVETLDWPLDIYDALKGADVTHVTFVPDAGHSRLIALCENDDAIRTVSLTGEQEGIGVACGAWLGGARAVLLMQSSGVGNCINALSMVATCKFPFLTVVTMRGQWGEFNPWQVPMGQTTPAALSLAGLHVYEVDRADDVGTTVAAAANLAFASSVGVAVLIGQRLIGTKTFASVE